MGILTFSGLHVSNGTGCPSMRDIAVSHCRIPMYAGHSSKFYSVAHHCVSAAQIADTLQQSDRICLLLLLHESEVAVYGDVPGPVKTEQQRALDLNMRHRVYASSDIRTPTPEEWKVVEFYDKLEQAASLLEIGMSDNLHQSTWNMADARHRQVAAHVVAENLKAFPPKEQLESDSDLVEYFLLKYRRYRQKEE